MGKFKVLLSLLFRVFVMSYYIKTGIIYDNKTHQPVSIQGISWFGFESDTVILGGLDKHPISFYFGILQKHGINSIRIPFSQEWIYYNYDFQPDPQYLSSNPILKNKKSIEILDYVFDMAGELNITILLDMHRLNYKEISQIWYSIENNRYTSDTFLESWYKLLDRYHQNENLITYGDNNPNTDWFRFSNQTILYLNTKYRHHNWLILVQGINWGRIFPKYNNKTLLLSGRNVVYSPHTYGRSVTPTMNLDPHALYALWDQAFGYLKSEFQQAIIIGEWGGRTSLDTLWMSVFAKYLVENNMTNNYFWSLTPNSDDVDGFLLNDWTTIDPIKKILLQNLQFRMTKSMDSFLLPRKSGYD